MRDETTLALRPDLFGQLAATDPFQGRARRLYERGQVLAVNGNQADVRVGCDARNNPLDLKEVPIVSGYIPRVGDWVAIQYEAGHSGAPWVAGPSMAADESEDTPGIGVFSVSSEEPADPHKSTVYFHEPASTWRGWNGAAWVDLGGGGGGLHNSLPDLQGGAAGEYYHLTAAQWNALVDTMPFGAGGVLYADDNGKLDTDADNFFWDATSKCLGIGTAAPEVQLHMVRETGGTWFRMDSYSDSASSAPLKQVLRWRGTIAAPAALLNGDYIYTERYYGYGTGAGQECYRTLFRADGDWDGANRGVYWSVYGVPPGATGLVEWLRVRKGQHLFPAGSAADPPISFISYPDMGIYPIGDARLGWSLSGAQAMGLAADGLGIGIDPHGYGRALYVYRDVAGEVSHVYQNNSADAAAGYYIYFRVFGGGDVYHRYTVGNGGGIQYWSYGIRQSDDRWVWSNWIDLSTNPAVYDRMALDRDGNLGIPAGARLYLDGPGLTAAGRTTIRESADNTIMFETNAVDHASLNGAGVWWLFPHSPTLTADGEAAMDSVHETLRWRMGTMQCLGASLVDDALVASVTVHSSGGELAETAISTKAIAQEFSTSGNTVKVVARGTAMVNPKGAGGGATMHIKFRIEGTDVFDLSFPAAMASPARWIYYEFSFDATIRGSTSWMISNAKAEYADWQQVGNPWPCTFTPTLNRYGRDAPFTVSGDVTSSVRCSITNAAPDASFITVAEHKSGLEQV